MKTKRAQEILLMRAAKPCDPTRGSTTTIPRVLLETFTP